MTTTAAATRQGPSKLRPVWWLASAQLLYVAWFGACVWVALVRARDFAGRFYIPYQGDPYTASADIWTGWSAAFHLPMMLTVAVQPFTMVASLGAAVGGALSLASHRGERGFAAASTVLAVSTVLVLATFVLTVTPAGRSMSGWILD